MEFYKENRFKKTEIGEIPEEWEVVRLGEERFAKIIMGQSPPSSAYNEKGIGLPFLQGKMDFGDLHPNPRIYCSKPIKIAKKNDILLSVRAPVGEVNIPISECCIGRGLSALRPNPIKVDFRFIFYYLKQAAYKWLAIGSGSTFKAIRKKDLETFLLPLPEILEQQKIASMLSCVDEEIENEKQTKDYLEKAKKWFMDNLLTGRVRVRMN